MFDVNSLTLGEVATVEDLAGQSIDAANDPTAVKGKMLAALAFVARKRTNPEFTYADALNLSLQEVTDMFAFADPTKADDLG